MIVAVLFLLNLLLKTFFESIMYFPKSSGPFSMSWIREIVLKLRFWEKNLKFVFLLAALLQRKSDCWVYDRILRKHENTRELLTKLKHKLMSQYRSYAISALRHLIRSWGKHKGSLQNKFLVKVGNLAQPAWPPLPPPSLYVGVPKKEKNK